MRGLFFIVTLPEFAKLLMVLALSVTIAIHRVPPLIPEFQINTPYGMVYLVPVLSGLFAGLFVNRFVNGLISLSIYVGFIYFLYVYA